MLDNAQKESVGINNILEKLVCFSPYGTEKLRQIAPSVDAARLERCFDNIEKALGLEPQVHIRVNELLTRFKNIRGAARKCRNTALNEVELFEVKCFLLVYEKLTRLIEELGINLIGIEFPPMSDALDILDPKGRRIAPFSIESGFSNTLPAIRLEKARVEGLISSAEEKGRLDALISERAGIAAREDAEEQRVMEELSEKLRVHIPKLCAAFESIGELDLTIAKALLSREYGAVRPKINTAALRLKNMTNPFIEEALAEKGKSFTRVSLKLKKGVTVITGANMGGKSVAIKTAVLNAALCRMGFFVFAEEAEIPLFDDICLIAEDAEDNFMSSFGAEMRRISETTRRMKNENIFAALDEPARGTNPAEGAAIVRAVISYLAELGGVSMVATHFDNVVHPKAAHYQTAGFSSGCIDYSLREVDRAAPVPKAALNICRVIGLDEELLKRIEEGLRGRPPL